MLLSGVSNAYTLILSIIYIAIACLLFTIRKSETAGKPALSWKLQFAIRCAIGFTISVFGTFMYIQLVNEDYTYGTPPYMYTIIAFIIAAYVLAILCGFLLNAGINNMTSYHANTDNIDYIRLSAQNNYYVMTDYENYFENVIKNIKISDKSTIKFIADIYNDNAKNLGSINEERYYTRSSHSYATYEVFFKEGVFGRYRKVFLKGSDVSRLAEALTGINDFCVEYKNLPSYEDSNVSFSDYISEDKTQGIYNTMLDEIKSMPFSDFLCHSINN